MQSKHFRYLALASLAISGAANAHPGHSHGAMAGLMHPFMGLDHLLAMLAVGVWAAQLGGKAKWLLPLSFVAVLVAGAGLAMSGTVLPMVEGGIATSVLLLGMLIALAVQMPAAAGAAMVGVFALFHGYAHGVEMPHLSTPWQYGFGFVVASALLHGAGVVLGNSLQRQVLWLRASGALIALSGIWMSATV
ncbi:HupE/UreJ family protein [Janthinobacterium fluminis]|uniref:HupE/UreJ family protein n=1 Tax=Janthinobacterium fluminis TaxID=2987524 RepID=A0ABT5JW38_9BURK|nr:HupE/UreJ family protein [Janthinobacterium fluminis]MDC8756779.1 HupE/UreJ family protein [Janthinobacterium fluminis]